MVVPVADEEIGLSKDKGSLVKVAFAEPGEAPPLELLPPLPAPRHGERLQQSASGCILVLALIAIFVGCSYVAMASVLDFPAALLWVFMLVLCAEACCALTCLVRILVGDAGVIRRSAQNCAKMPGEVADVLQKGQMETLRGKANVILGDRSFCVRCFVWRPSRLRPHHCSVCQRCVLHFDHHCQVLGRCIAGKTPGRDGWVRPAGNMMFFDGLIVSGAAGLITCIAAVLAAVIVSGS